MIISLKFVHTFKNSLIYGEDLYSSASLELSDFPFRMYWHIWFCETLCILLLFSILSLCSLTSFLFWWYILRKPDAILPISAPLILLPIFCQYFPVNTTRTNDCNQFGYIFKSSLLFPIQVCSYSSVVNVLINVVAFLAQMCGCMLNDHPLHF